MFQKSDILVAVFAIVVLALAGYVWMTDGSQPKHDAGHGTDAEHGESPDGTDLLEEGASNGENAIEESHPNGNASESAEHLETEH